MAIVDRRMLGPVKEEMGGDTMMSGSRISISNNVAGYLLRATGQEGVVEGVPNLSWDDSNKVLSSSADIYISGSSNNLYLHGVNNDGQTVRFKVSIDGGVLKIEE